MLVATQTGRRRAIHHPTECAKPGAGRFVSGEIGEPGRSEEVSSSCFVFLRVLYGGIVCRLRETILYAFYNSLPALPDPDFHGTLPVDDDELQLDVAIHAASTSSAPLTRKGAGHVCPTCGRRFGKANHLNRHLATHLDYRPYSCTRCSKAFARTDALQRHARKVHAVQQPGQGQPVAEDPAAEQTADNGREASSSTSNLIYTPLS